MQTLQIRTPTRAALVHIGPELRRALQASGVRSGVVHLWALHTTCAVTVNENADPDVAHDMVEKLARMVPRQEPCYRHAEGNSDSHLKTSLFGRGLTLLLDDGELMLGTWQGLFLAEWDGPRTHRVAVKVMAG